MLNLLPMKTRPQARPEPRPTRHRPAEELLLSVKADIGPDGRFAESTVEVTATAIRLRDATGTLVDQLPLADITAVRHEPLVGGGRLILVLEGDRHHTLCRYSQSLAPVFSELARGIEQLINHQPLSVNLKVEPTRCPTCGRMLPERGGTCPACLNRFHTARRMARYRFPYKTVVIALAGLSVVTTAVNLVIPLIQGRLIDKVLTQHNNLSTLWALMIAWAGVFVLSIAAQIANGKLIVRLSANISADLRAQLYRTIEFLQLEFVDKKSVGSLVSRVTHESNNIWGFLAEGVPFLMTNTLMLVGVISFLFYVNAFLTWCILAPVAVVAALSAYFWKQMRQKWFKAGQKWGRLNSVLHESLAGLRVVKIFAQEDREHRKFVKRNEELRDTGIQTDSYWHTLWGMISLVLGLGLLTVWTVGSYLVYKHQLSLGDFWKMNAYLAMVYGPVSWFANFNNWFSRAMASAQRIFEITDMPTEAQPAKKPPHPITGQITFENVNFAYDKATPVLKDLAFTVQPGEMIGLVGKSGSGKSTTINLLCGFYQPTSGRILIDGVDRTEIDLSSFRQQIGVVLQEPFLFDGTIAENIAYGKPGASMEEIIRAARLANAHNFIMNKPDAYDTPVGERGSKLSGGERQRISIARAILHDPKILILDEATSSVDVETEKQIQEAIANLIRGRTTIAIAHRLSTLRNASRLIVLDQGKIAEIGTHQELLANHGPFAKLVQTQSEVNQIMAA